MSNSNINQLKSFSLITMQGFLVFILVAAIALLISISFSEILFNNYNENRPIEMTFFISGMYLTLFITKKLWHSSSNKDLKIILSITSLICTIIIYTVYYIIKEINDFDRFLDQYLLLQAAAVLLTLILQHFRYSKKIG
ncbi:hypothetical protein [Photobacterium halotolerans]|uniref:hypothetical protein n=1 Tax=Photobacterium halotolerans TaxID=265726 RepID=UPI00047FC104|nr:hypothetical protein [Photobacterium halotolerans]